MSETLSTATDSLSLVPPRGRVRQPVRVATALGPAFVAAIAYVDPGNFATNFAGGASSGYRLVWVVVMANLVAMPIQYLSAKLGVVTGQSLPQLCRRTLPRPAGWLMWGQAEIVAMATDLAEFIGAAIGLNLLFRMPMPVAGACTAVLAFVVLSLQRRGHRPFEVVVASLLFLIAAGFAYLIFCAPPSGAGLAGGLVPSLAGNDTLMLAVGIIGATVMPHAIYLHSGLMSTRTVAATAEERARVLRFERLDIALAMGLAGLVNLAMLAVAAEVFHRAANPGTEVTLQSVHSGLGTVLGGAAALAFAVALLASGISSSSVGTAAGQIIMEGFLGTSIPLWLRRLITMTPALILLCSGVDPTHALVLSQVLLSFGIPFALVALLVLTSSRALMGEQVNGRVSIAFIASVVLLLSALNVVLLLQQFTG